jgi:hypothetical protein
LKPSTPTSPRTAAYDRVQQVVALFLAERPDEAAHVGNELLKQLPGLSSPRAYEALSSAVTIEGAPYSHQREVIELKESLRAASGTFTSGQL